MTLPAPTARPRAGEILEELLSSSQAALAERLLGGHAIDPEALAGWLYRGVSLGLPGWVDRLAWKTFAKTFHRDGPGAPLRGWNVRLRQGPLDAPLEPLRTRSGAPRSFGHFTVVPLPPAGGLPLPLRRGLLLDYGRGANRLLDPVRRLRDPLVALHPDDPTLLLGGSWLALGRRWRKTPSYFLLERWAPLDSVA